MSSSDGAEQTPCQTPSALGQKCNSSLKGRKPLVARGQAASEPEGRLKSLTSTCHPSFWECCGPLGT